MNKLTKDQIQELYKFTERILFIILICKQNWWTIWHMA